MHKIQHKLVCGISLLALHALANADVANGKTLHDGNCTQCHISIKGGDGTGIYTRKDRRVQDLDGLSRQVSRCTNSQGLAWTEQQHQDVVDYLNSMYYKFTAKP